MKPFQRIAVCTLLGASLLAVCIPVFAVATNAGQYQLACQYKDATSQDPGFTGSATNCGAAAGASCTMPYGQVATSTISGQAVPVTARYFSIRMNTTSFALAQSTPQASKVVRVGETVVCRTHQFDYAQTVADANAFCSYYPLYRLDPEDCLAQQNWLLDTLLSSLWATGIGLAGLLGARAGWQR